MNYEFHVGDYVEDVRGHTGYIKDVSEKSNTFTIVWRNYCGTDYIQMRWFDHYAPNRRKWEDDFARIGAYDFTKKEKKKIENLVKPQWSMPVEDLIDKINELVDAVNKLMDKEDKK
jgi:hypothetical protein